MCRALKRNQNYTFKKKKGQQRHTTNKESQISTLCTSTTYKNHLRDEDVGMAESEM